MEMSSNGCTHVIMGEIFHLVKRHYFHPFPIFLNYLIIIISLMIIPHPIISFISLISSGVMLLLKKEFNIKNITIYILMYLFIVFINPIFVHSGATTLFMLFHQPYTKEAVLYGVHFANMFISLLWWSRVFLKLIKSEDIIYLFSFPFKSLGIVIMIIFRLIPKFSYQLKEVQKYQKMIGSSVLKRSKDTFLTLFTWAFESSIDMADSMNARGYTQKRTSFHLYHFHLIDSLGLIVIMGCFIGLMGMYFIEFKYFYFYPVMKPFNFLKEFLGYGWMLGLCLLPWVYKEETND